LREIRDVALDILIVDREYLVAMEAESILQALPAGHITVATPRECNDILKDRRFDVVVIDASLVVRGNAEPALRASGAAVVFLSLRQEELDGIAGWPDAPVVSKPFDDERLLGAVKNAARGRTAFVSNQ
jgi:DNA-binding response OmpR family regulator